MLDKFLGLLGLARKSSSFVDVGLLIRAMKESKCDKLTLVTTVRDSSFGSIPAGVYRVQVEEISEEEESTDELKAEDDLEATGALQ